VNNEHRGTAAIGETLPYGNAPAVTGAEGMPDISGRNRL
jgi:hypothetical protein